MITTIKQNGGYHCVCGGGAENIDDLFPQEISSIQYSFINWGPHAVNEI